MNKVNYMVYLMAMTELIINKNNQTVLGDYTLEYFVDFAEIGQGDMYDGDACLAIAVRLKNKDSELIEWGNIYYKRLIKNSDAVSKEAREKLRNILNQILESSYEEKIDFILKSENKFFKTPYAKSMFIDPVLSAFLDNLKGTYSDDGFSYLPLGRRFPSEVIPSLEAIFDDVITKNQELSSSNKRRKRYKR